MLLAASTLNSPDQSPVRLVNDMTSKATMPIPISHPRARDGGFDVDQRVWWPCSIENLSELTADEIGNPYQRHENGEESKHLGAGEHPHRQLHLLP